MMSDKSKLMREMRKRRKDAGMVEYRVWCTDEQKKLFKKLENSLKLDIDLTKTKI